jgi:hypothetical protein
VTFPVLPFRSPNGQARWVAVGTLGPSTARSRRNALLSVSSCSEFLVAGFHPRSRSAFAVSHGLDGLTFLLPPGVFQPVTLMGFGYLLEYPWKVAGSGGRSHRRRVSLHDGFAGTRSVNHRSGSASGSSRKPGRVASVVEEVGVFPTGPALKPTAVAADTTGVPDR